jgi:hypothetical protein
MDLQGHVSDPSQINTTTPLACQAKHHMYPNYVVG